MFRVYLSSCRLLNADFQDVLCENWERFLSLLINGDIFFVTFFFIVLYTNYSICLYSVDWALLNGIMESEVWGMGLAISSTNGTF